MASNPLSQESQTIESGPPVAADNIYPYRVGLIGGLAAGAVMALAMALWGLLSGNGIWFPVNLIAATLLRPLQSLPVEELARFSLSGALVGSLIHFSISAVLGLLFALVLPTLPGSTFLWALIVGPLLWVGAQYAILPLVNPRMELLVSEPTFAVAHLAYSIVLGFYLTRADKLAPTD